MAGDASLAYSSTTSFKILQWFLSNQQHRKKWSLSRRNAQLLHFLFPSFAGFELEHSDAFSLEVKSSNVELICVKVGINSEAKVICGEPLASGSLP